MLKKTLAALAVCSAIALTGCASNEAKNETPEQVVAVYQEFANNPPTFEVQKTGVQDIDLLMDGIARFAQGQHEAMKSMCDMNPQGRQMKETLMAAAQAQNVPFDEAFIKNAKLSDADMQLYKNYEAEVAKMASDQVQQWAGAAETVVAFRNIVQKKDALFSNLNFAQKLMAGKAILTAGKQASYAMKCYDYFKQAEAGYQNAMNAQGQR